MKNLLTALLLLGLVSTGQAQDPIVLEELRLEATSFELDPNSGTLEIMIPEDYEGQFHDNPLKFAKSKFDINRLLEDNEDSGYESYTVTFKSSKGYLSAEYNREGSLVSSHQEFRNIALPRQASADLYKDHQGWTMVRNKHIISTRNGEVTKDFYKVRLRNGQKGKSLKIIAPRPEMAGVVSGSN